MNELVTVRMEVPKIPSPKGNLDEIQKNIDELLASYTGRVYTAEEIGAAKKDRAQLNAWEKQLASAAKTLKDHYMEALDAEISHITSMRSQIKQCSSAIDAQVKAVEQAEKEEKKKALEGIYIDAAEELAELIPFDRLFESRWLNKTVSLSEAGRELRKALEQCREALRIIRNTCGEDAEACTTEYLRELSLNSALNEHQRRVESRQAQQRAEAARRAAEQARREAPVIIPPTQEERDIRAQAVEEAQAGAFITQDGRLDMGLLQTFADPEPRRHKYRFWVDFTEDDIAWFKQGAAERGIPYGPIKTTK